MKNIYIITVSLLIYLACSSQEPYPLVHGDLTKKVLLIGVDGLSSTRLGDFNLPNYDRLIADGLY